MAVHGFEESRVTTVDSARYLELADQLRHGRGPGDRPETFRTPGYPLLLALLSLLPGERLVWTLVLQCLLDLACVAAALAIGWRWGSPLAGVVAGVIVAVDPTHVISANLVMSDVLCAAAVAGAFLLAERPGRPAALASGLLLSAAVAVRPVVLLMTVPWAVLLTRRQRSRTVVVAAVLLALAFPTAWTLRNGLLTGRWTPSTAFELNLGLVWAPKVLARGEGGSVEEARRRLQARGAVFDPGADATANRGIALAVAAEHPGATVVELFVSTAEMLLAGERKHALRLLGSERGSDRVGGVAEAVRSGDAPSELSSFPPGELLLVAAQVVFNLAVLALAALGAGHLYRRGDTVRLGVVLASLAVVLGPSLVVASARMRIPVSFLLAVLAGIGAGAGHAVESR